MARSQEHHDRVRATIAETALRLFGEHGFDAVSVEEIAQEAGVSRATVFRHFPLKESILFASFPEEVERLHALLEERPDARNSVPGLREVVRQYADYLEEQGDVRRRRFGIVLADDRLYALALQLRHAVERTFASWMGDGEPPSLRQEVLSSVASESLLLGFRRWREAEAPKALRGYVDEVFDEVLQLSA